MSHAGMDGEITAKQIRSLQDVIEAFNKTASKQADDMVSLTNQLKWLTILLAFIAAIQVVIMLKQA